MDETDGAIQTQTRTQDATPTPTTTTPTNHRTPSPQTSGGDVFHRPGQEDHQEAGPSPKKKKKSFMRGMLEEGLLADYKSVDPTPRARRRLKPAEG